MRTWGFLLALAVAAVAVWAALALVLDQSMVAAAVGGALLLAGQGVSLRRDLAKRPGKEAQRMTQEADRGRRLAIYNPATGLLAQWYFELRVDEEAARARRYGLSLVILTLAGTQADDSIERNPLGRGTDQTAAAVSRSVRGTDLVGTVGFSELAICLVHCDRAGAIPVIRRLMDVLGAGDWRLGIAVYPDDDFSGKDLIQVAQARSAPWKVTSMSETQAA